MLLLPLPAVSSFVLQLSEVQFGVYGVGFLCVIKVPVNFLWNGCIPGLQLTQLFPCSSSLLLSGEDGAEGPKQK